MPKFLYENDETNSKASSGPEPISEPVTPKPQTLPGDSEEEFDISSFDFTIADPGEIEEFSAGTPSPSGDGPAGDKKQKFSLSNLSSLLSKKVEKLMEEKPRQSPTRSRKPIQTTEPLPQEPAFPEGISEESTGGIPEGIPKESTEEIPGGISGGIPERTPMRGSSEGVSPEEAPGKTPEKNSLEEGSPEGVSSKGVSPEGVSTESVSSEGDTPGGDGPSTFFEKTEKQEPGRGKTPGRAEKQEPGRKRPSRPERIFISGGGFRKGAVPEVASSKASVSGGGFRRNSFSGGSFRQVSRRWLRYALRPASLYESISESLWPLFLAGVMAYFAGFYLLIGLDWYFAGLVFPGRLLAVVCMGCLVGGIAAMAFSAGVQGLSLLCRKERIRPFGVLSSVAGACVFPAGLLVLGLGIQLVFQTPVSMSFGITSVLWTAYLLLDVLRDMFGEKHLFKSTLLTVLWGFLLFILMSLTFTLK